MVRSLLYGKCGTEQRNYSRVRRTLSRSTDANDGFSDSVSDSVVYRLTDANDDAHAHSHVQSHGRRTAACPHVTCACAPSFTSAVPAAVDVSAASHRMCMSCECILMTSKCTWRCQVGQSGRAMQPLIRPLVRPRHAANQAAPCSRPQSPPARHSDLWVVALVYPN